MKLNNQVTEQLITDYGMMSDASYTVYYYIDQDSDKSCDAHSDASSGHGSNDGKEL